MSHIANNQSHRSSQESLADSYHERLTPQNKKGHWRGKDRIESETQQHRTVKPSNTIGSVASETLF